MDKTDWQLFCLVFYILENASGCLCCGFFIIVSEFLANLCNRYAYVLVVLCAFWCPQPKYFCDFKKC